LTTEDILNHNELVLPYFLLYTLQRSADFSLLVKVVQWLTC